MTIYLYHKISFNIKDSITISPLKFLKDLISCLAKQVVYLDEYDETNPNHIVLTFDDGFNNFKKYALPLLKLFKYPFELFIVGDWVGEQGFLNENELKYAVGNGGRLQYHSKTHADLSLLDDKKCILQEITTPEKLKMLDKKGFKWLAYPCWKYNNKTIQLAKNLYLGALSGNGYEGDCKYTLKRTSKG